MTGSRNELWKTAPRPLGLVGCAAACITEARRDSKPGPKGCGQDVRTRQPGHGWPGCRLLRPADQAGEQQPEVPPTSPELQIFMQNNNKR